MSKHTVTRLRDAAALWSQLPPAPGRCRGRRAEGLRFERKVQAVLHERYATFCPPVPFFYSDSIRPRGLCIPDGFFFRPASPAEAVVVEIKLRHSAEAWMELRGLYRPVLARALDVPVRCLEIVRYYDPGLGVGGEVVELDEFLNSKVPSGTVVWGI